MMSQPKWVTNRVKDGDWVFDPIQSKWVTNRVKDWTFDPTRFGFQILSTRRAYKEINIDKIKYCFKIEKLDNKEYRLIAAEHRSELDKQIYYFPRSLQYNVPTQAVAEIVFGNLDVDWFNEQLLEANG